MGSLPRPTWAFRWGSGSTAVKQELSTPPDLCCKQTTVQPGLLALPLAHLGHFPGGRASSSLLLCAGPQRWAPEASHTARCNPVHQIET